MNNASWNKTKLYYILAKHLLISNHILITKKIINYALF